MANVLGQLASKVILAAVAAGEANKAEIVARAATLEGPALDAVFADVEKLIPQNGVVGIFGKEIAAAIEAEKANVKNQVASGDTTLFDLLAGEATKVANELAS